LTPYQALVTGTVNAARWFGLEDQRGTVEVGEKADLVLLDDDPLSSIDNTRRIHGVMLRGRWLDRAELDRLLSAYERTS
jgi:imidazolonepropionase-like amidohydrolase